MPDPREDWEQKRTGIHKQRKDAGNRTLCPYRNFNQAIATNTKAKSQMSFDVINTSHVTGLSCPIRKLKISCV